MVWWQPICSLVYYAKFPYVLQSVSGFFCFITAYLSIAEQYHILNWLGLVIWLYDPLYPFSKVLIIAGFVLFWVNVLYWCHRLSWRECTDNLDIFYLFLKCHPTFSIKSFNLWELQKLVDGILHGSFSLWCMPADTHCWLPTLTFIFVNHPALPWL
jgi:hypothetical protein